MIMAMIIYSDHADCDGKDYHGGIVANESMLTGESIPVTKVGFQLNS